MILTRAQKVRLGVFLVVGATVLAGALVVLTGLSVWKPRDRYTVRFAEDVSGLERSAPVKYKGLRVGRVESMRIAPDDPKLIEVTLALRPGTVLYQGASASLDSAGLTGLKSINLTAGDPRRAELEPGAELSSGGSLVERLTGRADEISLKVELVANQLARWTRDENRVKAEEVLGSVSLLSHELTEFLKTNRVPMQRALDGVGTASRSLATMTGEGGASIKSVEKDLHATLEEARTTLAAYRAPISQVDSKEVAEAITNAKQAFATFDERFSKQELGQAISDLQKSLRDLTRLLQEVDLAVRAGREDFTQTLNYLRQAAENLREFSRIIAQDPSAVIHGRE